MRVQRLSVILAMLFTASAASAQVHVTMAGGQVSISAKNATVGQILAEWARVGQTRIVNGERLSGGPITMELNSLPEIQALEILLRGAGGYVIAPRALANPAISTFDRILVIPVSNAPRAATPTAPVFQPTRFPPPMQTGDDEPVPGMNPPTRFPLQRPTDNEGAQPASAPPSQPGLMQPGIMQPMPIGVARPGMVAPTPGAKPATQQP